MANPFDQFDAPPAQETAPSGRLRLNLGVTAQPSANPFDQFDSKPAQPQSSAGEAFGGGILNAATFNFRDELSGLARAGGLDPKDPDVLNALTALAKGAYLKAQGDPGAQQLYDEQVQASRKEAKTQETEHPYASLAGHAVGAAAFPAGLGLRAGTLAARIGRGAAGGTIQGGLTGTGAAEGDIGERIPSTLVGAGVGAGVGAAVPAVAQGAAVLANPVVQRLRALRNPDQVAAERVAAAIGKDVKAGQAELSPAEFTAARNAGLPVANVELGGEGTRALARSAGNTSPQARSALQTLADDRFSGQSDRAIDFIENIFGANTSTTAQREALKTAARGVNKINYQAANVAGSQGLWSPELERLAGSDAVSTAMQRAAKAAKDEAIVQGQGAFNPKISFTPDGRIQFNRGPNGVPTYPDLQYWDLVRRELSDAAQRAGHGTSEARRLNDFASKLNTELDKLVPEYQTARQGAARFFDAQDALTAGENFVRKSMDAKDAVAALRQMSPQEQQLFKLGFASKIISDLRNLSDRADVTKRIGQSPEAREKLKIVLGPRGYDQLNALMTVESSIDKLRTALGNSTTARQLTELGLAGGLYGAESFYTGNPLDVSALSHAALVYGLARGKVKIDQRIAERVANILTSHDPTIFAQGIRQVANDNRLLTAIRDFNVKGLVNQGSSATGRSLSSVTPAGAQENK